MIEKLPPFVISKQLMDEERSLKIQDGNKEIGLEEPQLLGSAPMNTVGHEGENREIDAFFSCTNLKKLE